MLFSLLAYWQLLRSVSQNVVSRLQSSNIASTSGVEVARESFSVESAVSEIFSGIKGDTGCGIYIGIHVGYLKWLRRWYNLCTQVYSIFIFVFVATKLLKQSRFNHLDLKLTKVVWVYIKDWNIVQ